MAEKTGFSVDEVAEALDVAQGYTTRSLDAPIGGDPEDSGATLADTVGQTDSGYESVELAEAIEPAFRELDEREQYILRLRFVDDLTQSEIAARCGVSQMHVSRLLRRSLNELVATLDVS